MNLEEGILADEQKQIEINFCDGKEIFNASATADEGKMKFMLAFNSPLGSKNNSYFG